ncbi:MAG TPA: hypothetical protein VFA18_10920 [Gemmataceae bacterium]|nr:hypothetical protein [Gemmataceae bacterium]
MATWVAGLAAGFALSALYGDATELPPASSAPIGVACPTTPGTVCVHAGNSVPHATNPRAHVQPRRVIRDLDP